MVRYEEHVEDWHGISLIDSNTIRKKASLSTRESFECIEAICYHFMERPNPMVVPVYSFRAVQEPRDRHFGTYVYEYDMKRLAMLDHGEKSYITLLKSSRAYLYNGLRTDEKEELERLTEVYPALVKFMETVYSEKRYTDIHDCNILKDEYEDYKLIDLEGFIRVPFERNENDWIRGK